ncbi:MAG: hypothetical protein ACJ0IZ_07635 [Verrucomicrobiales bacterium]
MSFEEIETEDGSKKMVEVRRRRRRRSKQPKKEKEKRVKLAKRFLIIGIISLIIIIFSFYFFMITWIGGQGFRKNVSDKISEIIEQDVSFGEFSLQGLNLRSKGFKTDSVSKEFLLLEAKLELLQTRIHPRSFFSSDWSMGNVQSMKGELLFGKDQFDVVDKKFPINDIYNNVLLSKAGLGLNSSPNNFNFSRLSVDECDLKWQNEKGDVSIFGDDVNLIFSPSASSTFNIDFVGGDLVIPMWPNLKIQSVSGTVKGSQYLINQSKFNLSRNGEVTLNGRISLDQSADYQISSDLRGIDISEILSADWMDKCEGTVDGGINISGKILGEKEMQADGGFSGSDIQFFRNPILKFLSQSLSEPSLNQIWIENLNFQFFRNLKDIEITNLSGESLPLLKFNQGKIKITSDGYWDGRVSIEIANEVVDRIESDKKRYFKRNNEFSSATVILQGDSKDLKLSFEPIIGK